MSCARPETVARLQACRHLQTRVRLLSGDGGKAKAKVQKAQSPAPKPPYIVAGCFAPPQSGSAPPKRRSSCFAGKRFALRPVLRAAGPDAT
ncbi:MAG: hypothetical protein ABWY38_08130 [Methyloceanibacter sp.]